MQPLERITRLPFTAPKPHSIRLVEVPAGQKGIKLSAESTGTSRRLKISQYVRIGDLLLEVTNLTRSRLDMNTDLMSLHIGDRILEINGVPVKETPLENVENFIRNSDTVLQVSKHLFVKICYNNFEYFYAL